MVPFSKEQARTVLIYGESGGSPVTGLTAADFTLNVIKNATRSSVSLTGLVTEVDSVNTPGYYAVSLPSSVFDTTGTLALIFTSASTDGFSILGRVWTTESTVEDIEGKVDTIDNVVDSISTETGDIATVLDYIKDIRALNLVNKRIDNCVYDAQGNLTSARVRGWNPGADISVDSPIVTVNVVATYDVDGQMTNYESTE